MVKGFFRNKINLWRGFIIKKTLFIKCTPLAWPIRMYGNNRSEGTYGYDENKRMVQWFRHFVCPHPSIQILIM